MQNRTAETTFPAFRRAVVRGRLATLVLSSWVVMWPPPAMAEGGAADDEVSGWDVAATPGEETEATIDVTEGTWMSLDVSPDGREIVFDLLGDLYLLPIEGGEARALTSGPAWDMQPRFSPDGSEIAFTSDRAGGDNIWVIARDGSSPRQISHEDFRLPNSPAWSPDGEWIAARKHFTSRRSLGAGEIWLWHHSGTGSGLRLNERPNDQKDLGEPAFSPDGRYVYFSRDSTPGGVFEYSKDSNGEIYTIRKIDRETGEIEVVVDGEGGAVRPTPSPDGRQLAFVRRVRFVSTLFLKDLRSGEERAVYAPLERDMQEIWAIHGVYPAMAWTPDSLSIVFWAGGKIHRLEVATGNVAQIPFHVRQTHRLKKALRFPVEVAPQRYHTRMLRWVQLGPDGKTALYQALGRIWLHDLSTGETRRLTRQTSHFELYPELSRDGRFVVFVTWDDQELGSVRIAAVDGSEERVLSSEPGHYREPALSPDGTTVVYRKDRGNRLLNPLWSRAPGLYRVPVAGGEPVKLRRMGRQPHFGAAPDRVYFVEAEGEKKVLRSVRLDGLEERTHLSSANATEMRVSHDGRWAAFVERFHAWVVPFTAASEAIEVGPKMTSLPLRRVTRDAGESLHWSAGSTLTWSLGAEMFSQRIDEAFVLAEEESAELPEHGIDVGFDFATDRPAGVVALVGGKVLTMAGTEGAGVIADGTVLVRGNRIAAVGPRSEVEVPEDAVAIDVSGKVVMPGLIDVHFHGPQGVSEIQPEQNWENLAALAFGVTTIHDPSNDTSTFFAASELQRAGLITAPRLFSTGTILYGAAGDVKAIVESVDDARSHLRRLQAVGAFSVKSYNQPRRDQRQKIVAAARELGMMVVNEGGALFQHNMTMVLDGHTGIEHSLSVAEIYDDVVQLWSQSAVGNTPTLVVAFGGIEGERYWYQHTNVWENERLLRFVPRPIVDARSRRRMMAPEEEYNHVNAARVVAKLDRAGVGIQLGAHGQREGLGAHWELWMFEQGGMTPTRALRAATLNGARYLGLDRDLGSLEPGKLADLIVLERDPLDNLRNSESVVYTMVNGRLYDAWTLDELGTRPRSRERLWFEEP